jgi:transposase
MVKVPYAADGGEHQAMMGQSDPQRTLFYHLSLETFVPAEHPLPAIRRACRDLYAPIGRPSIPPEQLFLALVGGYLLGITSERKLVMELQCNMALRWFVGLNLDQDAWDASIFSQNRRRRFDQAGLLEQLFDATITRALAAGLVSRHVSADGTLVRANASFKCFGPLEVALDPAEYKRRLRAHDAAEAPGPDDPGNRTVDFRGEQRSKPRIGRRLTRIAATCHRAVRGPAPIRHSPICADRREQRRPTRLSALAVDIRTERMRRTSSSPSRQTPSASEARSPGSRWSSTPRWPLGSGTHLVPSPVETSSRCGRA